MNKAYGTATVTRAIDAAIQLSSGPVSVARGGESIVIRGRQLGMSARAEAWAAEMRKRGYNVVTGSRPPATP